MAGVNKVIIVGNLGADPELKNLPSGDSVVNFSLATSESYTDKGGQKVEKTEWHRVEFFGRNAEIIHEYCRKGSLLYVEGSLQTANGRTKTATTATRPRLKDFGLFLSANAETAKIPPAAVAAAAGVRVRRRMTISAIWTMCRFNKTRFATGESVRLSPARPDFQQQEEKQ